MPEYANAVVAVGTISACGADVALGAGDIRNCDKVIPCGFADITPLNMGCAFLKFHFSAGIPLKIDICIYSFVLAFDSELGSVPVVFETHAGIAGGACGAFVILPQTREVSRNRRIELRRSREDGYVVKSRIERQSEAVTGGVACVGDIGVCVISRVAVCALSAFVVFPKSGKIAYMGRGKFCSS